jgi:glyoxylase-like metal-dependent hydrolase (beta-lactamase superfamily II)
MATVKILFEGYCGKRSCSTIVLVKDKNLKLIVDPGTVPNPDILIKRLKQEKLSPEDIDIVFITHSHMDHYRNIALFPKAKALDYWGYWHKDENKKCNGRITNDIKIIKTPGHSYDSTSLVVKTEKGTIIICGDVFWKEDYPKSDPYAEDRKKLKESRQKILKLADYIIPGHGRMFKT